MAYREKNQTFFDIERGKLEILGSVVAPVAVAWEADSDPDRVLNP